MKRKIVAILVCMLLAICSTFTIAASTGIEKQILVNQSKNNKQASTTLITEAFGNQVIEVDSTGTVIWQISGGLNTPVDAERLANGNTLITDGGNNRVIEVNSGGNLVWAYNTSTLKFDAERLVNGNTLITEIDMNRVIEVNTMGTIVWQYTAGLYGPADAERLVNGNTLICDTYNNRVIEVDSTGTIVWQKTGINFPVDAERLGNGNTLITEYYYKNRVLEVDSSGNIVWAYNSSNVLFDAERFANGNTLITEFFYGNRIIEIDSSGTIVWQKTGLNAPIDAERISHPPNAPNITGKICGKAGKVYEYTFNAIDPDGDDVRYFIDWGDNNTEWTGFNASSTDVKVKHKWSTGGTYNITTKAQDIYGFVGPEGKLTVNMPRNKCFNYNFNMLERFLKRFQNLFPILQTILRLQ